MSKSQKYSLVMLVEDGESDFVPYLKDLDNYLGELNLEYELILAINGAGRFALQCLQGWPTDSSPLQTVELTRKVPSGICLQTVLADCSGEILVVCGPYRQIADEGLKANSWVSVFLPRDFSPAFRSKPKPRTSLFRPERESELSSHTL